MTQKTIYLLNIGDYAPELTAITYPTIYAYADRIGAEVCTISERRYHEWPLTYEKLQIHDLAFCRGDDWAIYIDSDALLHPELPDVTDLIPRDTVAHNGSDFSPVRFADDQYFRRDGRHIGSCNWFTVASSWCLDLWHPLDDLTPDEAMSRIQVTVNERGWMKSEHLIDDYALSRNIARFGLKFTTLKDVWARCGLYEANFFHHEYTNTIEDTIAGVDDEGKDIVVPGKISNMKTVLAQWRLI